MSEWFRQFGGGSDPVKKFLTYKVFMMDISSGRRYIPPMSNPAPSSLLSSIAAVRRLSAIALWFATLLARILPGAGKRAEQAEAWRYIEATMTQFADLLERLANGEIEPARPKRAVRRSRPDSVTPRANTRATRTPRARKSPREKTPKRPPRALFRSPDPTARPPRAHIRAANPPFSKMQHPTSA